MRESSLFKRKLKPEQVLLLGFFLLILFGGLLLSLPIASQAPGSTSLVNALFTSTSAVCVTGLVVYDTASHWTLFGQTVIMVLIQIGGLGFMTFGILFAILLGRKIGLKSRLLLQESLQDFSLQGVVKLSLRILAITLAIELVASFFLMVRWIPVFGLKRGLWMSLFHAVSAFNNAGFDIFGQTSGAFSSLTAFYNDPLILGTLSFLIIIGGLGFTVLIDLVRKRRFSNLVLHTKLIVTITLILIASGTLAIYLLEMSNPATLGQMGFFQGLGNAFFQAITPRTAGFNSIDIGAMTMGSHMILLLFMFIGASPGSTAGGIKTTTFATMFLGLFTIVSNKKDLVLFRRKIPSQQIYRVFMILVIALGVVATSTFLLTITETAPFLDIVFEVVSAFGTVGLTLGLTQELTIFGKLVIILTMFIGRLGPATVAFAIARERKQVEIGYPEERIILG